MPVCMLGPWGWGRSKWGGGLDVAMFCNEVDAFRVKSFCGAHGPPWYLLGASLQISATPKCRIIHYDAM